MSSLDKNFINKSTYTIGPLTCNILPGEQAREYIIHSTSRAFSLFDVIIFIIAAILFKWNLIKYGLIILAVWLFLKRKSVRKESILAIKDVGVQVKTYYCFGSSVSRFINRNKIDDIIINEGISFWQIKSYMAIIVKDENKLAVVFENLLPRLDPILLDVYRGVRSIIFKPASISS